MVTVEELLQGVETLFQNQLILRLFASLLIMLIAAFIILLTRKVFGKLASVRVKERKTLENTEKMIEISIMIITIFLIIYVLTQQTIIVLFILGVILVVIAASWEVVANLAAYYIILITQAVSKGEYVTIGSYSGRIRQITPIFTVIEAEDSVQAVPNRLLLGKGAQVYKEPTLVTIVARVWGFEDPEVIDSLESMLRERLDRSLREAIAIPGEAEIYIDEVTMDGVVVKIVVPMAGYPVKVNRRKVSKILKDVAQALRETGYSFSVSLERPNGMQARWRMIA